MSTDKDDFRRGGMRNGRQINFDDDDFSGEEETPQDYGRRDRDWADDLATRADGRISADYGYREKRSARTEDEERRSPRREDEVPRSSHRQQRQRRREDYDDRYPEDNNDGDMERPKGFVRRHPVLMNMIYVVIATVLMLWILMWFLDYWTFHGQERVVPDVKGQTYASAAGNVDLSGLRAEITDSVFDNYSRPGTVVEQIPVAGAKIKKGGTVYLTIVAFSPKLVTVPEFYNVSVRQARSMFEGLGITDIREVSVVSEYEGLVLGAKFNGVSLQPGARIPVSAVITLEVGTGYQLDEEFGAAVDTIAIDNAIDELNIE